MPIENTTEQNGISHSWKCFVLMTLPLYELNMMIFEKYLYITVSLSVNAWNLRISIMFV
jgi:hypothetical protein